MKEFVGIKSPLELILEMRQRGIPVESLFKREALIFSRIICPHIERLITAMREFVSTAFNDLQCHIEYLNEKGLLFPPPVNADGAQLELLQTDSEFQALKSIEQPLGQLIFGKFREAGLDDLVDGKYISPNNYEDCLSKMNEDVASALIYAMHYYVRELSVKLRVISGIEAYPVQSEFVPHLPLSAPKKHDTVSVILNALPMPDESVPWERIIEYRSDPESQSKFLALRHWMSEVARAELTRAEVEEKFEYLIDQYQQHMKLHRMKTNAGTLETIVTTTAEVLGDIASFKWGKAAQALFSLKRRQVALLEGELSAPGSEVAYIVKARQMFS